MDWISYVPCNVHPWWCSLPPNRPVITGPIEGAAIGNLLAQAMALGDIQTMDELRDVVRRSEAVNTYEPHHTPEWEAAYAKLKTLI